MTIAEFGSLATLLLILVASAHLLGHLFVRLRQPRVIGEIAAGVLLGPCIFGRWLPEAAMRLFGGDPHSAGVSVVLGFLYNLGMVLLMFASGAKMQHMFGRDERSEVAWLAVVGTGLPFVVALAASGWLPISGLMGPAQNRAALVLVFGIAVAVTSVPVISRIFYDLGILGTRFARLVLSVAMLEDLALWAVLAVATALAHSGVAPNSEIVRHVLVTLAYFALALTLAPRLLKHLTRARWNVLRSASPVAYTFAVMLAYIAVAAALDVSLVFAAFLAGVGGASDREVLAEALAPVTKFSFAVFIPLYFLMVGYRLDLSRSLSLAMVGALLLAACAVKITSVVLAARCAGFAGLDALNLAVATNARGGPGIVLASIAFDAGIVSGAFYTGLVLLAVLTSQAAGAWLDLVLRRGWPLLSPSQLELASMPSAEEPAAGS